MLATDNNLRKKSHHPHYLYSILSFRNFQACNFTNKETFQKCFYRTQKHSPRSALQKKCQNPFFNKDAGWGLHFYLHALTFSWEFWELSKCSFFDRIPPVATSENIFKETASDLSPQRLLNRKINIIVLFFASLFRGSHQTMFCYWPKTLLKFIRKDLHYMASSLNIKLG